MPRPSPILAAAVLLLCPTIMATKSIDKLFDQPPPHSLLAEMALLGAMILDPAITPEVVAVLDKPGAFFTAAHQTIYSALVKTYEQQGTDNLALLAEALGSAKLLDEVGGIKYLERLAAETPGPATAPHFARLIAEKHRLRLLIDAAGEIVHKAYHASELQGDAAEEIAQHGLERMAAATANAERIQTVTMATASTKVFDAIAAKKPACWPTLFPSIDRDFGGIPCTGVTTIMGYPSHGKTTWMLQAVSQVCESQKISAAVFSNEQQADRIAATLLSMHAGVSVHELLNRGRYPDAYQWKKLTEARAIVEDFPIQLVDTPMHAGQIFAQAKALARKGTKIIVVDYIQDLPPPPNFYRGEERITEGVRQLKRIPRELGIAVVMVSQLGKEAAKEKRRPSKYDGLYSSSIEQASDVMIGVWRPHMDEPRPANASDYQLEDWRVRTGHTELLWLKNKYGRLGEVHLRYRGDSMQFVDDGGDADPGLLPGRAA